MGNIPASINLSMMDVDKEHITAHELLVLLHDKIYDNGAMLKYAFEAADADRSGYVDYKELRGVVEAMGFPELRNDELAKDLYKIFDKDGDGKVDYDEFVFIVTQCVERGDPEKEEKGRLNLDWKKSNSGNKDDSREERKKRLRDAGTTAKKPLPDVLAIEEALLRLRNYLVHVGFDLLEETFKKIDNNGDGELSQVELKQGLQDMGFELSDEMNRRLFVALDRNGDGHVGYEEFTEILKSAEFANSPEEAEKSLEKKGDGKAKKKKKLIKVADDMDIDDLIRMFREKIYDNGANLHAHFRTVDVNDDGSLDPPELQQAFQLYGFDMSENMAAKVIKKFDKDGDQKIRYSEFLEFMREQNYAATSKTVKTAKKGPRSTPLPDALSNEEALLRIRNTFMCHPSFQGPNAVRDIFTEFDEDLNGVITYKEFSRAMKKVGFEMTEGMGKRLFSAFDKDNDKSIKYKEFAGVLASGVFLNR